LKLNISVPATTANLGPGFDCLGLALSLRNRVEVSLARRWQVAVEGEGAGLLPEDESNLVVQAMMHLARAADRPLPPAQLVQHNEIPVGSGLGSSAAAVLAGLLAADALLESGLPRARLLALAAALEGHADNVAAALFGGLVLVAGGETVQLPCAALDAVVVLPAVALSTRAARAALPASVPLADAVFNLGQMGLLLHALAHGDRAQLGRAMADRLHQPYRTALIPGLEGALSAARAAGAAACLSGAGPAVIAFAASGQERHQLAQVIGEAFAAAGIASRFWLVSSEGAGAQLRLT
jgi:homoserine kinase